MSIDFTIDGGVAVVTINRPEKKNALTFAMRGQVQTVFQQLQDDMNVRAIVFTGAGADFSAGADVGEMGTGVYQSCCSGCAFCTAWCAQWRRPTNPSSPRCAVSVSA